MHIQPHTEGAISFFVVARRVIFCDQDVSCLFEGNRPCAGVMFIDGRHEGRCVFVNEHCLCGMIFMRVFETVIHVRDALMGPIDPFSSKPSSIIECFGEDGGAVTIEEGRGKGVTHKAS